MVVFCTYAHRLGVCVAYISAGHAGVWCYMLLDDGASIWHTTYIGLFGVFCGCI